VTPTPVPAEPSSAKGLVLACPCGSRALAGFHLVGREVRCRICKGPLRVPERAEAGVDVADPAEVAGVSCSICLSDLGSGLPSVRCPACRLAYHGECWRDNGGCGAFGCPLAPEVAKVDEEGPVQTAWGDSKHCPRCGKAIQAVAIKCRHCKADLGTRDALSSKEWRELQRKKEASGKGRVPAVAAFLCSASCVGLPVGVGIALYHLMSEERRKALEGADRFLHVGAVALAGLYLVLLLTLRVAGW